MGVILKGGKETAYGLQVLARKQMIVKLEADILQDMNICEIEGWDKTEYITELYKLLESFRPFRRKL